MTTTTTTEVYCRRCRASFKLPLLVDPDRARIVELARSRDVMGAMRLILKQASDIDLRDAKAVEMHITYKPGICNRCTRPLPRAGQLECPNCGGLNFNW